jgi:serine/threonine protein kinase
MRPSPTTREQPAEEPDPEIVERATAIDDYLGGFAPTPSTDGSGVSAFDEQEFANALDMLLALWQAAAADGAGRREAAAMPARVGRYAIAGLAGRGGFSTVWRAFDPVLKRRVAVKVCRPEAMLSPSMRRRFRREAEIASRLVHPHIVPIFEVGADAGRDFITAEFCDGGSLSEWLARHPGPLPLRTAARLVLALTRAVAHAHEAGVLHRDIKPANVMLVPTDAAVTETAILTVTPLATGAGEAGSLTVKLGDFGLGKIEEDAGDALTPLTATGSRIGTPAWMAPKQIDRSFGPTGSATDIHALGLLLDRLLTGRCLRSGKTNVENYREILLDDAVSADHVVATVSRDLAAVCMKCLAKLPAERYASASSLANDLSRWLDGRLTIDEIAAHDEINDACFSPDGRLIGLGGAGRRPAMVDRCQPRNDRG